MQGHSMKMMWGCVALIGLAVGLALDGVGGGVLFYVIACLAMMGAMLWMMMGDRGAGSHHDGQS